MCSSKAVGLLLHRPARYNRQDTLHRLCSSLLGRSYHPVALIHRGPIPRLYYRWSHLHLPCRYLIVSLAFRVICCHVLVLPTVTSGHRWVYPGMGYRGLHLQHVLTWTPKVAKATSVAANEEGCYGDGELSTCLALTGAHHTGKRSVTLFSGSVARSSHNQPAHAITAIQLFTRMIFKVS